MNFGKLAWLASWGRDGKVKKRHDVGLNKRRTGEAMAIDITQNRNSVTLEGEGIAVHYSVEGIDLPLQADASFAVWGLLAAAMEGGFDLHLNMPIDPVIATNAEHLARIWEMWVPSLYRSISIRAEREWRRPQQNRLPCIQLYSGGCDSTFAILKNSKPHDGGYVATVYGLDYRSDKDDSCAFAKLLAKTDPLLKALNYKRIVIRTTANRWPQNLTHGFTLAGCLFLLSDLFSEGGLTADLTPSQDLVVFPWGTNHITNAYLAGSDFAVRTVGAEIGRTEKLAIIAASGSLPFLACCRKRAALPANCGVCAKCVRTKAMLLAATGKVPEIFLDNALDARMIENLDLDSRFERAELFDLYGYAKDHGVVDAIPGLEYLVERCRAISPTERVEKIQG